MKTGFLETTGGLILLAAILLTCLFVNLGGVPLFDEDEGAYAEVTRQMLESSDLITPRLNGKPFFHKPPLFYWTQAASVKLFGLNEFALRLPSAVAALAWAAVLFAFAGRMFSRRTAWFAVFFLATALQTNLLTKAAIPDALLNLFITSTLFAIYSYYTTQRRLFLYVAYAGLGLGFLTKGPIAVVIPVLTSFLFYASVKKYRDWFKGIANPVGWGLLLAITLPWYVALYILHGAAFIKEFFLVQNVGRFLKAMEGHHGPIVYYIPVLLVGLLPFTTLCINVLIKMKHHWQSAPNRFLILWFAFVFIFFSLSGTKLHHYIVYGYTPLLILMATTVDQSKNGFLIALPMVVFAIIICLVPIIADFILPSMTDPFAKLVLSGALNEFDIVYKLISGVLLLGCIFIGLTKRIALPSKIIVLGLFLSIFSNVYLIGKVAGITQMPIKTAALMAREKGYKVVMWKMNYSSFNVYYKGAVEIRTPRPGDIVITKATSLIKIKTYDVLFQKHGIVLAKVIESGL